MSPDKFPATRRLQESEEFDAVFDHNEIRISCRAMLFLAKRNGRGFNRLGMVVSKKNIPMAVNRNRLKRRVREAFRTQLDPEASLDVVVLMRPYAGSDPDLRDTLVQSFKQLSVQAKGPVQ